MITKQEALECAEKLAGYMAKQCSAVSATGSECANHDIEGTCRICPYDDRVLQILIDEEPANDTNR